MYETEGYHTVCTCRDSALDHGKGWGVSVKMIKRCMYYLKWFS